MCFSRISVATSGPRAHKVVWFLAAARVATVVPHEPAPSTATRIAVLLRLSTSLAVTTAPRRPDARPVVAIASRRAKVVVVTSTLPPTETVVGRSPFPPIADYGFLSDCETTALVAPSGNVEWLCLPRMDSPSVFGAILDRHAGGFRLGPADVTVPAARRYLPGTMVLETSWGTATGWIIVRDLLVIGPWHHEDELSDTHRRAPTDYDADHVLLRTVRCVNGEVQVTLDCEPMFDYGRRPASWSYTDRSYHQGVAQVRRASTSQLRLTTDMRVGLRGRAGDGAHAAEGGRRQRFCALTWSEHEPPYTYDEAYERLVWTAHHWQHWLARGDFPDHPWRNHLRAQRAHAQGPHVRPHRRARRGARRRRCPRRRAASATGTTATAGSATPPSRCGACTPSASTGRPTTSSGSSPTSPSATRSCR